MITVVDGSRKLSAALLALWAALPGRCPGSTNNGRHGT
jgi:hypothetical protein